MLGDSLNTSVTVIATLQNSVVAYNTLKLTYLLIVGIAAQLVGIFAFWTIQKRFKLSTKVMFDAVMIGILVLDGWGMIGIWTQSFGFHNECKYLAILGKPWSVAKVSKGNSGSTKFTMAFSSAPGTATPKS